jgi:outer membrane protein OmpA-like peptidoglycan-associated protein
MVDKTQHCKQLKKATVLFFILFNFNLNIYAQNLILNGNFEFIDSVNYYLTSIEFASPWLGEDVDLYGSQSLASKGTYFNQPFPPKDTSNASHFAGVLLSTYNFPLNQTLIGALSDKLIGGKEYKISFDYLCYKNEIPEAFNIINIVFADNCSKYGWGPAGPVKKNTVRFKPARNKKKWMHFEKIFLVQGFEKCFVIEKGLNTDRSDKTIYYYFDNFILAPVDSVYKTASADSANLKNNEYSDSLSFSITNIILQDDILFGFGKTNLSHLAEDTLRKLTTALNKLPYNVMIYGYTDSIGSLEYNQILSQKRAAIVAAFLSDNGLDSTKITFEGLGEANPIGLNANEEGRRKNRRVEIHIVMKNRNASSKE